MPPQVWNRKESIWEEDENLRLECFDPDTDCCDRIRVRSDQGSASYYHPRAMGSYIFWTAKNGRTVYKHETQELFFYYNDWGNLKVRKISLLTHRSREGRMFETGPLDQNWTTEFIYPVYN